MLTLNGRLGLDYCRVFIINYENLPMQYIEVFNENLIFLILLFKTLIVGTGRGGSKDLCFGPKIRKIGIPLHNQIYYIKVGNEVVHISRTCFPDDYFYFDEFCNGNCSKINTLAPVFTISYI